MRGHLGNHCSPLKVGQEKGVSFSPMNPTALWLGAGREGKVATLQAAPAQGALFL